jgi:[protein-PII] uridylyltransferase
MALQEQKTLTYNKRKNFRRQLLKEFMIERAKRNQRHDSMTNYLEPQLKFGPGGLRDMQQALMIWFWYHEKFEGHSEIFPKLQQLKGFLLTVRQKLHLSGYVDTMVAASQADVSQWFGFKNHYDFMRELQKILTRVSFYGDLIFEIASKPDSYLKKSRDFKQPKDIFDTLKKDPSLIQQGNVLHNISKWDVKYHSGFKKVFDIDNSENGLRAIFRSQLIASVLPEFKKVMGVVQHDQYHRYTVDAHIFQAVRRVKRVYEKPSLLGKLSALTKSFKRNDWDILLWTALYHDIGKARGKDHSQEGKLLAEQDLAALGFSKNFISEVAWMAEHHLVLSTAAFRKDPHSPQVWQELFDKGIHGERLRRLAIFTAIDIYATNPEAWTAWKEKLIFDLVKSIETPHGNRLLELKTAFQKHKVDSSFLQILDAGLLASIPLKELIKDIQSLQKGSSEPVHCFTNKKHGTWVRFHNKKDQPGLFLQFVSRLWQAGMVIHHAYIHTHDTYGVYDWFEIKTDKSLATIKKLLEGNEVKVPMAVDLRNTAKLSEVSLVAESEKEWVFSFRDTDKKGVLISAAQTLHDLGLQIRWAKIHTWGRQVDDVFGISPAQSSAASDWTQELQKRLVE